MHPEDRSEARLMQTKPTRESFHRDRPSRVSDFLENIGEAFRVNPHSSTGVSGNDIWEFGNRNGNG